MTSLKSTFKRAGQPGVAVLLLAVVVAACGGGRRPTSPRGDGASNCTADVDCDDTFDCTIDTCGVGGVCAHAALDELCTAPLTCEVGRGCVDTPSCASDADCDDGASCTLDTCGVGGVCTHMGIDARCTGPGSTCDPATGDATTGCTAATGCASDADCDDGFDCTVDACGVDATCGHTPIDARCAMGETCTTTSGCFAAMPCTTDADCDDGVFCNGDETCMPEFGCQPPDAPHMCDDSNGCTLDSCDATADMCVFACDSSRTECMCPAPAAPCDGVFDMTPTATYSCAIGTVNLSVSQATFTCIADIQQVAISTATSESMSIGPLGGTRMTDGNFDVNVTLGAGAGGCVEDYRLVGMFTDPDHFMGTLTAAYTGGTLNCLDCAAQSFTVSGTRRP